MSHRLQSGFPGMAAVLALVFTLALPLSLSAQDPGQTGEAFTISGVVRDAEDQTPLQYTVVGIPEMGAWAVSEADGSYSLDVSGPGVFRFVVLKRGFYMADQPVTFAGPDDLNIALYKEQSDAPLGPGRLVGRVSEKGSGNPIRNATVRVTPADQEESTDRLGRFMIDGISAGALLVEVERSGYAPLVDTLAAFPGVTLALDVSLSEDESVPSDATVEAMPLFLEAAGVYRRAENGRGHRFGRFYLEERDPLQLSEIVETVPGVRRETGRYGRSVITARGTGGRRCTFAIYLDGSEMPGFDIDNYPTEWVEALEVYEGFDTPFEYDHTCGVVLIWSRRSE